MNKKRKLTVLALAVLVSFKLQAQMDLVRPLYHWRSTDSLESNALLNFNPAYYVNKEDFTINSLFFSGSSMTVIVVYEPSDSSEMALWSIPLPEDTLRVGLTTQQHGFEWDANGNMILHKHPKYGDRRHCWDEENRLKAIENDDNIGYYGYDAAGERSCKITAAVGRGNYNGHSYAYSNITGYTLYASPYLVSTTREYTKHYYAGSERVCSKLGGGGLSDMTAHTGYKQKEIELTFAYQAVFDVFTANYTSICDDFELAGFNADMQYYQLPETDLYFYHPDHLGSSSWITDASGQAVQHLQYLPFGETRVDRRTTSWGARYSFSAKEKDEESGYSYFGARYYDPLLSIWLSVDPMASKYPSQTPYLYCANNPLKIIDPNGEDEWDLAKDGNLTKRENGRTDIDIVHGTDKDGKTVSRNFKAGSINNNPKEFSKTLYEGTEDACPYTTNYMEFSNNETATVFFEFAAENTTVEWALNSSNDKSLVGTSHKKNFVDMPFLLTLSLQFLTLMYAIEYQCVLRFLRHSLGCRKKKC